MNTLNKIYLFTLSKANSQSFHQKVVNLMQEAGFDTEPDTQDTFDLYRQKTEEMKSIVAFSRQLEQTEAVLKAKHEAGIHYKYINNKLKSLALNAQGIDKETCTKVQHEILETFPLGVLRRAQPDCLGALIAFRAHLQNDWMTLLAKLSLTEQFQLFSDQLDQWIESNNARAEEKSQKEKGKARRIMAELAELYTILSLYVEAWSNTISSTPTIQQRQQRALHLLNEINEIVSSLNHSLAVSASNRRRAKKNQ